MAYTWTELSSACKACQNCSLSNTRTNVVFGEGVWGAEILFIGEAPGKSEDEQGLPFIGRSGKLMDTFLDSIGLSRQKNIFIANIVKCRPPENRDPSPQERKACLPWLMHQINLLQPKIVVCVGRISAQVMIKPGFAIMKEHGLWTEKNGIWYTATLHPAAILRNPNNKHLALDDYAKIQEKINEVCLHT